MNTTQIRAHDERTLFPSARTSERKRTALALVKNLLGAVLRKTKMILAARQNVPLLNYTMRCHKYVKLNANKEFDMVTIIL